MELPQGMPATSQYHVDLNPALFAYDGHLRMSVNPVLSFQNGSVPIEGEGVRVMLRMNHLPVPGEKGDEMTITVLTRGLETEEQVKDVCESAIEAWTTGIRAVQEALDSGLEPLDLSQEASETTKAFNLKGIIDTVTKILSEQHEEAYAHLIGDETRERDSLKSIFDESEHHFLAGALDAISDRYTGILCGMAPISDFVLSLLNKESDKETEAYKTARGMLDRINRDLERSSKEAQGIASSGERVGTDSRDSADIPTFAGIDRALATAEENRRYLEKLLAGRESATLD